MEHFCDRVVVFGYFSFGPLDFECELSASEWEPADMSTESECDSNASSDWNTGHK